jgi:TRAP-type C4-dicarboxylate transport system substrate-binding protein
VKFRTFNSDIQSATVEALGAVPVSVGIGWINEVSAGRLRGLSSAWPSTTTTALEKRQATSRTTSYFGQRCSY